MRTKENDYKSVYYTNQTIRKKIDKLLEKHASLQATLGLDSKQKQIKEVVRQQLELESKIKELDEEYWSSTFKVLKD